MTTCKPISIRCGLRRVLGLVVLLTLGSCAPPSEKAREALIKRGIAVDEESVVTAAAEGQTAVLELLQTAGVDLTKPPAGQATSPLITAILRKSASIPLLLQATPANRINVPDAVGRTALSHALSAGNDDLVLQLLGKSADPAATTHPAGSVLEDAIVQAKPLVVRGLIERLPPGGEIIQSALLTAIKEAEADTVALLLDHQASPNTLDGNGVSVLELAAAAGDVANVDLLVKAGATIDPAKAKASSNPLKHAVQRNSPEMARQLLRAGCLPDLADKDGGTPTGMAATLKRLPLLQLFLEHKASPQPHFQSALVAKDWEVLELFLKHGLDVNQLDDAGNPPLVQAALRKDAEGTKWLLAHGADPALLGKLGQSAFGIAQAVRQLPVMEVLLEAGGDANEVFKAPVAKGFLDLIDSDYFKTWLQKDQNLSPMMLAASRGDVEALRLLMKYGGKRGNQTKGWKRYAVNFACENSHIPAAQLLLGQDPEGKRDVRVVVSLSKQQAWIYRGSEVIRKTEISTGKSGFSTPSGKYVISDKQADWKSTIYKVAMPFFMRLSCRDFGLHAGVVTGRPASHGCVRLPKAAAAAFFSVMQIGDPVTIVN
jgi:ankyrin repeat protein